MLEAGWILSNLAYGSEEQLTKLVQYGGYGKPGFVEIMTNLLNSQDLILIDQIMFLFGNITGTSPDLRASTRNNFDLLSVISGLMNLGSLPKIFIKNYIWVATNISYDAKHLDQKDIRNLSKIFGNFLEVFKEQDDELALQDLVKGLSKLSEISDNENIEILNSKPGLIEMMCDLLSHKNIEISKSALRFIG